MDYLEYKGYKGSVEYSKADNCLFGKVLGMSKDLILYEGSTMMNSVLILRPELKIILLDAWPMV